MTTETDKEASENRVDGIRARLIAHRDMNKLSWSQLADLTGIAQGTISQFGAGTYAGNNLRIAEAVERYFAGLEAQTELLAVTPKVPGYVETQFSRRLMGLFAWAQQGDIVPIACAPGLGKTITAREYKKRAPNVWLATMTPATSRLQTMQIEVLIAMGEADPKGTPQQLSRQIKAHMVNSAGLLIIDEAHELSDQAIEEMRSWHDATGVGIALVGDYRVIARIEGKREKKDRAQIFRRAGMRHVQHAATFDDADPLLDAWGITDAAARDFARGVAVKPGALGSMTKMLKLAGFNAGGAPIDVGHLRAARTQLTSVLNEI